MYHIIKVCCTFKRHSIVFCFLLLFFLFFCFVFSFSFFFFFFVSFSIKQESNWHFERKYFIWWIISTYAFNMNYWTGTSIDASVRKQGICCNQHFLASMGMQSKPFTLELIRRYTEIAITFDRANSLCCHRAPHRTNNIKSVALVRTVVQPRGTLKTSKMRPKVVPLF